MSDNIFNLLAQASYLQFGEEHMELTQAEREAIKAKLISYGCPEDIAAKAAANSNGGARYELCTADHPGNTPAEKVHDMVEGCFLWAGSPEGFGYWHYEVPLLVAAATEVQE